MSNLEKTESSSPADDISQILIDRMDSWRRFLKGVIRFFTEISKAEKSMADSYRRCSQMEILQSKQSNPDTSNDFSLFKKLSDSFQSVPYKLSLEHEAISRSIELETLLSLKKIKKQVKVRQMQLIQSMEKRRKETEKTAEDVEKAFVAFKNTVQVFNGVPIKNKEKSKVDPWISSIMYANALKESESRFKFRQTQKEAEMVDFELFESLVFHSFKNAMSNFTSLNELSVSRPKLWMDFSTLLQELDMKKDTEAVTTRMTALLSNAKHDAIFIAIDDEAIKIVKEGVLHRPKLMNGWKERYFVLTSAGYLHEFIKQKDWQNVETDHLELLNTIYLADYMLGAHSLNEEAPQEFELLEQKTNSLLSKPAKKYRIRGQDLNQTKEWWNAIAPFVKIKLTATSLALPADSVEDQTIEMESNPDSSEKPVDDKQIEIDLPRKSVSISIKDSLGTPRKSFSASIRDTFTRQTTSSSLKPKGNFFSRKASS